MIGGFINVYKPSGEYSGKSVGRVKAFLRTLGYRDIGVGHMGTLDPLAEGVLPIAIGRATRLFDYLLDKDKEYIAGFELGYETTTLDSMGEVTRSSKDTHYSIETLEKACRTLEGDVDQIPPMYSAKNVDGVRAYDLARRGENVSLKPKRVRIDQVRPYFEDGKAYLDIKCGGGTYVRSIIRDLAYELGTYGTMVSLKRTRSGAFSLDRCIDIRDFSTIDESIILPIDYAISHYDRVDVVDGKDRQRLSNGIAIPCSLTDGIYRVYYDDVLQGIGVIESNQMKFKTRLI